MTITKHHRLEAKRARRQKRHRHPPHRPTRTVHLDGDTCAVCRERPGTREAGTGGHGQPEREFKVCDVCLALPVAELLRRLRQRGLLSARAG
jgi:hypothetical protein